MRRRLGSHPRGERRARHRDGRGDTEALEYKKDASKLQSEDTKLKAQVVALKGAMEKSKAVLKQLADERTAKTAELKKATARVAELEDAAEAAAAAAARDKDEAVAVVGAACVSWQRPWGSK